MKHYAWYNTEETQDYLFTFPESEDPDYRNTTTTVNDEGDVMITECSLTIAEVESLDGVVGMDDIEFQAQLDHYGITNECSRIGKTPHSLPPPNR